MTRRAFRLMAGSVLTIPLAVVAGCGAKSEKTVEGSTPEVKSVSVTVADIEHRAVERTVEAVGTLKGWEEVTVGAKRGGRVLKVLKDIGDTVKPGEPLVELETVDAKLAVLQAETLYLAELARLGISRQQAEDYIKRFGLGEELIRGDEVDKIIRALPGVIQTEVAVEKALQYLTRQRQLNTRGAGTVQELQNFENDYNGAVASRDNAIVTARNVIANALATRVSLDVAKQTLADMVMKAPVPTGLPKEAESGEPVVYAITRRPVHEGQMVKEGDPLFDLVIQRPLRFWANVPERFTPEIEVGQEVRLSVASRPGEPYQGSVARINPSVDPISRTFQVEAIVPNATGQLRPGGFAKASILTKRDSEAIVVASESVVKYAGVTKIFILDGAKARAVEVVTGLEGRDWIEVQGDLPTQGKVVTSGQSMLANGTPIVIREEVAAEPNPADAEEPLVAPANAEPPAPKPGA